MIQNLGESSWDHPLDTHYKEMFTEMKEKGEGTRHHRSYHSTEDANDDSENNSKDNSTTTNMATLTSHPVGNKIEQQ